MEIGWRASVRNSEMGQRRLKTKAKLIDGAREVFNEIGYDAATVDDIVERCGVSRATFYHYFTGKQDVYREAGAAYGDAVAFALARLDYILEIGDRDGFRSWLADRAMWAAENSRTYVMWTQLELGDSELSADVWRGALTRWLEAMPWFVSQWSKREEAFLCLAAFIGHTLFFHHHVLTKQERSFTVDLLVDLWFPRLRTPFS